MSLDDPHLLHTMPHEVRHMEQVERIVENARQPLWW